MASAGLKMCRGDISKISREVCDSKKKIAKMEEDKRLLEDQRNGLNGEIKTLKQTLNEKESLKDTTETRLDDITADIAEETRRRNARVEQLGAMISIQSTAVNCEETNVAEECSSPTTNVTSVTSFGVDFHVDVGFSRTTTHPVSSRIPRPMRRID